MKIIKMRYILLSLLFGTTFFLHTGETVRKGGNLAKWKAFRNVKCSFSGGRSPKKVRHIPPPVPIVAKLF